MAALWICEKYAVAAELARLLFGGIVSPPPPPTDPNEADRTVGLHQWPCPAAGPPPNIMTRRTDPGSMRIWQAWSKKYST